MRKQKSKLSKGLNYAIGGVGLLLAGFLVSNSAKHIVRNSKTQRIEQAPKPAWITETERVQEPSVLETQLVPKPIIPEINRTRDYQKIRTPEIDYRTTDFSTDSDEVLLARMLFGEAENCKDTERIAIAHTALNRIYDGKKWNGETLREVILKPWQYSCFNKKDANREKLMNPERYNRNERNRCLKIAEDVLSGKYPDPTSGATHYFNPRDANPKWANEIIRIGEIDGSKHDFYREE